MTARHTKCVRRARAPANGKSARASHRARRGRFIAVGAGILFPALQDTKIDSGTVLGFGLYDRAAHKSVRGGRAHPSGIRVRG
jgi:hypothetical protein